MVLFGRLMGMRTLRFLSKPRIFVVIF